jgi:hypothetical protein
MRAPPGITAPEFPVFLKWVNVPRVRMDRQLGHPVLLEFWDFCRPSSLRTLPYVRRWYERYADAGLQVIGVHCPGFAASEPVDAVKAAVARLRIPYPVLIDPKFEVWQEYGNAGWPARYLWGPDGTLFDYHYGEGAYDDTELAIAQLLGIEQDPLPALRPEDVTGTELVPQTEDQEGAYSGPYVAGGVWAVLDGEGTISVNGHEVAVDHPGAYLIVEHPRSTEGVLELRVGPGVTCYATCFSPGLEAA